MSPIDNVVVIGGAGFIGRHVTSQLREAGCQVTVVSRSAGSGEREEPGLRFFRAGVADATAIDAAIEGAAVVYDLSMGGGATWEDFQRDCIEGSLNVARACGKHRVRRLLYTSTISALNLGKPGTLYDSPEPDTRVRNRGFYSRAKIFVERALMKLHRTEGLPVAVFRPGIVLGAGGMLAHGALGHAASDTCILGWGEGNNPLPCVLVQDVAKALVLGKDAPGIEGKAFNLSGDIRPTAKEFVAMLRERTLRNFRFYPRSVSQMAAMEWILWGIKTVARSPNNVRTSRPDLQNISMAADLDCSAAKELLGWNPVSDPKVFWRETIDSHLKPFKPGDLRLEAGAIRLSA